ncbi:glycosyltransferase [Oenococcus sicerae]|uniref:Glycosyltransferase n=1 Tax=Oenococcus sicerae TaxID=2203724 RepID=A0AAJ1R8Z5_9LACO|nr:glycosyltransferase family 2 protein [Oenococcus sicerae]MDN6899957.1 glycosyltransferase [Oenococcus sicerae]QAS69574.1 glycosyltransferase [Oenococcus sicerae]
MPVYNGLDFLGQAIGSILDQSYQDLELIIVDDGSNRDTKDFLSSVSQSDKRIRIFHQKNSGQSVARNNGLAKAKGKYIYFMDSDDLADLDLIEKSIQLLNRFHAETVIFDIGEIDANGNQVLMLNKPNYNHSQLISVEEALDLIMAYSRFVGPTTYLAAKSVYEKNDISFPVGMIFEDQISTPTVYAHSQGIVFLTEKPMYWYRRRGTSATADKWTNDLSGVMSDLLFALNQARDIYLKFFSRKYVSTWHFHRMVRFYNFYFPQRIRVQFANEMKGDLQNMSESHLTRREKMVYWSASFKLINLLYRNFRKLKDKWIK